ncbi:MAG: glycosidase [Lachnospiraceae bacterium]|nr:glycosidase [Lachnospiraceae bacterium]
MSNQKNHGSLSPMLNAYPDSMGGKLSDIVQILSRDEFADTFGSFYILPSLYNTDLDRGFSVIDYDINNETATKKDIDDLKSLGIDLKLDFILNHASVLSPQFRDLLKNGEKSEYADFFINWNKFWDGYGEMTADGYIKPDEKYIKNMFFRKPGLPLLMVKMPDGKKVPYWNTFYQEVLSDDAPHKELMEKEGVPYLGQMDLNINSNLVWNFYDDTLKKLSGYGAKIVRLDAFAYAPKAPGEKNFLNEPATWDVLEKVKKIADKYSLKLLPEIHASYGEKIYETISEKGYVTYDFFLPGLMIYSIENNDPTLLLKWANEIIDKKIETVNMLGCHDGIPMLDLKGMLPESEIQSLIDLIVSRGGRVKDLHGAKNMYYQVNATYYSALGEDDKKMLLARAIQMFMPGKPQVWYLDLFAGNNDYEAVKRAGKDGHKEINRTNLKISDVNDALKKNVVKNQLLLLNLRTTHPAFSKDSKITVKSEGSTLIITWQNDKSQVSLFADLSDYSYKIL